MKSFSNIKSLRRRNISGFTLLEMMITVVIFIGLFISTVCIIQVFAMRVYTLGATKLSATAGGLKVLDQVRDGIREAKTADVGDFAPATLIFTPTGTNKNQGNALRTYPDSGTNNWTVYYLDTTVATNSLKMATTANNGSSFTTPTVLATYITNLIVFDAEDFQGNILTSDANNRIIRMELDFYQWEYPLGYIGNNAVNAYDFYKLTTKITLRDLD